MAQTSEQSSEEAGSKACNAGVGTTSNSSATAAVTATPALQTSSGPATNTIPATLEHDDKDFDPSAEALIDEIDDERTLEEEEAIAADPTAVQNELDDLKRESEMPIEELLAYYERMRNEGVQNDEIADEDEEEDEDFGDADDEEEEEEEEEEIDASEEVRKSQERVNIVDRCNDNQTAQQPQAALITNHSNHLPTTQTSAQAEPSIQVNPTLSNSHPLPPHQSQPLLQSSHFQPAKVTDRNLNKTPTAHETVCLYGDGKDSMQHQDSAGISQKRLQGHDQLINSKSYNQEQNVSIDCVDAHQMLNNHHDVHTIPSKARPKHSMTEFLVDTSANPDAMFKTLLDYNLDDSDDFDEDYSYTSDEYDDEREWRRVIHIGPEYQAVVPDGLSQYENDLPPYENEDKLVWRCTPEQSHDNIIEYLKTASLIPRRNDISISSASVPKISDDRERLYRERMQGLTSSESNSTTAPISSATENPTLNLNDVYMSQSRKRFRIDSELEQENALDGLNHPFNEIPINQVSVCVRDDNSDSVSQDNRPELSTEDYFHGEEELLYLLLQCNHNCEEALRRRRLDPFKYYISEPMTLWSQDECLSFEHGLRIYGKNFHLIRENKVPTRTRAEVVAFYYSWKKSERHDVYTDRYKLDRKRSLTHPGTTDYMDRFIEDTESSLNATSSTPTPTMIEGSADTNQLSNSYHDSEQPAEIKSTINCSGDPDTLLKEADEFDSSQTNNATDNVIAASFYRIDGKDAI